MYIIITPVTPSEILEQHRQAGVKFILCHASFENEDVYHVMDSREQLERYMNFVCLCAVC